MAESQFVSIEDRGPVRWLTMHNPAKLNAIPAHGWDQLAAALSEFGDSAQRALVLRGAGENFCSGAEMQPEELEALAGPADGRRRMQAPGRVALLLHRLPQPTVAAVDGAAVGAGMNLAIGCDIAVATSRARFGAVFVRRGLALDMGGTWLLPRIVGLARARELALTGRIIDGTEAYGMGLVARVVEPEQLPSVAEALAMELAAGAPVAQRFIKTGLSRSIEFAFEQALAYEQQSQAALLASDDASEGATAFLEGREPDFRGR